MPSRSVGFFQADVAATENSDLAPIFWMATVWVSLLYSAKPLASSQRSLLYLVSFVLWVLMNIFSKRFLEPEKSLTRWVQYILLNVHFQFCARCTISNAERLFFCRSLYTAAFFFICRFFEEHPFCAPLWVIEEKFESSFNLQREVCSDKRSQTRLFDQRVRRGARDAVATMLPNLVKRSILSDFVDVKPPKFMLFGRCLLQKEQSVVVRHNWRRFWRVQVHIEASTRCLMTRQGHIFFDLASGSPFSRKVCSVIVALNALASNATHLY